MRRDSFSTSVHCVLTLLTVVSGRAHVAYTENLVKCGHAVFLDMRAYRHTNKQTDTQTDNRHTDALIAILRLSIGCEVTITRSSATAEGMRDALCQLKKSLQ